MTALPDMRSDSEFIALSEATETLDRLNVPFTISDGKVEWKTIGVSGSMTIYPHNLVDGRAVRRIADIWTNSTAGGH